jgi:3-hydroxyisobutyrate dehydrogenase
MTSTQTNPRVAILGLGLMGSGMARRLLGAGFPLTAYNRSPEKAEAFVAEGARAAATPHDAAGGAEIVISIVADDSAAREVWLSERGALGGAAAGTVLIECGTVTPEWISELAKAASQHGCELLDAPVTGSRSHAAEGQLTFLVGGSAEALERVRPVLLAMSRAIVHVGPTGSGALLKLINNFLCGVQTASLAEAIALIERSGLDREVALGVLTNGAPGSGLVKALAPRMTARDYTPNFALSLMSKDLGYARREGERFGIPMETARVALEVFERARAAGHGERDFSAVVEPLRERSNA